MLLYLLLALIGVIYLFLNYKFSYWKRKNVESFPVSIPFGNIKDIFLLRRHYSEVMYDICKSIKGPFAGIYCGISPVFIPKVSHFFTINIIPLAITPDFAFVSI